jgi:tetratricopeptide (TPR) repeat protein
MKSAIVFVSLCFVCLIARGSLNASEYYRSVDKDGNVHITNAPSESNLNYSPTIKDVDPSSRELSKIKADRYIEEGRSSMSARRYIDAVNYFERSLQICKAIYDSRCQSIAIHGMGDAYSAMGNKSQADAMYRQASELLTKP